MVVRPVASCCARVALMPAQSRLVPQGTLPHPHSPSDGPALLPHPSRLPASSLLLHQRQAAIGGAEAGALHGSRVLAFPLAAEACIHSTGRAEEYSQASRPAADKGKSLRAGWLHCGMCDRARGGERSAVGCTLQEILGQ